MKRLASCGYLSKKNFAALCVKLFILFTSIHSCTAPQTMLRLMVTYVAPHHITYLVAKCRPALRADNITAVVYPMSSSDRFDIYGWQVLQCFYNPRRIPISSLQWVKRFYRIRSLDIITHHFHRPSSPRNTDSTSDSHRVNLCTSKRFRS